MLISNSLQTWVFKYLCFTLGTVLLVFGIYIALKPVSYDLNEFESTLTNHFDAIIMMSAGVTFILVNLLYWRSVKIVSISYSKLMIQNGDKFLEFNWVEIQELKRVRFVRPPLYKLKFKDDHLGAIFFATESHQGTYTEVNLPFMSLIFDHSQMGRLIGRIKNTYDI